MLDYGAGIHVALFTLKAKSFEIPAEVPGEPSKPIEINFGALAHGCLELFERHLQRCGTSAKAKLAFRQSSRVTQVSNVQLS
jgi:hypothetical protein